MVDDEVDQATVNRRRGEDYFVTGKEDITPINRMISDLASTYDLSYLGYTATHQANVLAMHAEETLYPESAFVLDSHPLYLGPIAVFHTYRNRLVEPHQVMDLSIPKGRGKALAYLKQLTGKAPDSLVRAVLCHAVSGALHRMVPREIQPHGKHHAMMLNVARQILVHDLLEDLTHDAIRNAAAKLQALDEMALEVVEEFRSTWEQLRVMTAPFPDVERVLIEAVETLDHTKVFVLNMDSTDHLDPADPDYPDNLIVIGGDILSRGLTIEGLRTTYFLRDSSVPKVDTSLQMGRFFGPHLGDRHLVSVHMSPKLMQLFSEIAWLNEQHRMVLRHGWELDLRVQDAMLRTKGNIRPTGASFKAIKVHTASDKVQFKTPRAPTAPAFAAMASFLRELEQRMEEEGERPEELRTAKGDLRGVLWTGDLDGMLRLLDAPVWSNADRPKVKDVRERCMVLRHALGGDHPVNFVLRNGSRAALETSQLPASCRTLGLRQVVRAAEGGRHLLEVQSGGAGGTDTDWLLDKPALTATGTLKRWRSTENPLLMVLYPVGPHPIDARSLDTQKGTPQAPAIAAIVHMPYIGPGGSGWMNARGEEE